MSKAPDCYLCGLPCEPRGLLSVCPRGHVWNGPYLMASGVGDPCPVCGEPLDRPVPTLAKRETVTINNTQAEAEIYRVRLVECKHGHQRAIGL